MNSKFQPSEDKFDDVEGHGKNSPVAPDAEVEGHGKYTGVAPDAEVEGHGLSTPAAPDTDEETNDVEGHGRFNV